ncbi:hypothetical protein FB567DRAFT_67126 [Paraphoma chrysanthemicola]|uniref:BZIP domain-containing protein n=1 Tax=Paraphoma chrysanthemicola TaxID=798071 RepID=A0A8K0VX53_9PLEO|nr:hypothetical protein FB567DRAFT_67126 [Paraphoma chrysanthemicola]
MSSDSEGHTSARKRSRSSEDGFSGAKEGKKARGRPRVDTQDATAADRRRTQIRLAQRAYRQRKESTIVTLKQESTQLHSIIEQMNKTFLRFKDSVQKSGLLQLNPALARELKSATDTFSSLSKTSSEMVEAGDEDHAESTEAVAGNRTAQGPRKAATPVRSTVEVGWGYSAMPDRSEHEHTGSAHHVEIQRQPDNYFQNLDTGYSGSGLIVRRQPTVGELFDQSRESSSQHQPDTSNSHQTHQLPFGLVDLLDQHHNSYSNTNEHAHIYSVNIPTPDVTPPTKRLATPPFPMPNSLTNKTVSPVFTYSHDETTFARRLTRAALESGFHLLSTANTRPSALSYVFKLSLPYLSLEEHRSRFKMMLSRSVNEDLDFWETPFIHLGGAGTHYPRKDGNGNILAKKNMWTIRQIGPLEKHMVRLENIADGRWQELDDVDLSAFEGQWFDAHDVQGYLEEHWGCRPNPKSSFAECIIEEDVELEAPGATHLERHDTSGRRASDASDTPELVHSTASSSTASSTTTSVSHPADLYKVPDPPFGLDMSYQAPQYSHGANDFSKFSHIDLSFDQTLGLDLAPGFDYGFPADNSFGEMNMALDLMEDSREVLPVVKQTRKKSAVLQLNILVDEIIKHGVCLGRAPGFRRKDVDMAVKKALITAF